MEHNRIYSQTKKENAKVFVFLQKIGWEVYLSDKVHNNFKDEMVYFIIRVKKYLWGN